MRNSVGRWRGAGVRSSRIVSAVAVVLGAAALAAGSAYGRPLPSSPSMLTGAASSAQAFASWDSAFGGNLQVRMMFQSWGYANKDPDLDLDGQGIPMISWEPWMPPPPSSSPARLGRRQPRYSNQAIAGGKWDAYITRWAQAIKAYGKPVILRPMYEFNGFWYPWSHNPKEYVLAWRHMWNIFHAVGADNVTWVWSFQVGYDPAQWTQQVAAYWPGARYVDVLGMSLIRFSFGCQVQCYTSYLALAHSIYHLPTMITEANVEYSVRLSFLTALRPALAQMPYNLAFIWSQAPSYEQASDPAAGDMDWDARKDPGVRAILTSIAALRTS